MNETITITYITALICLFGVAGFTFIVCGLIFGSKEDDWYESQIRLKDEKIKALSYDNTQLAKRVDFKNKLIKQLTDDLEFAKDSGKLEIIKEMEK